MTNTTLQLRGCFAGMFTMLGYVAYHPGYPKNSLPNSIKSHVIIAATKLFLSALIGLIIARGMSLITWFRVVGGVIMGSLNFA